MPLRLTCLWLLSCALAACGESNLRAVPSQSLALHVERMSIDDRRAREEAGDALRELGATVVPTLVRQLQATDSPAARAAGRIVGVPVTTPAVLVRGYAASALGELGPAARDALDELDAASREVTPEVSEQYRDFVAVRARAAAMKVRGRITEELAAELRERQAPGWRAAIEVAAELGPHGAELVPLISDALGAATCPRRDLAARALGRIGACDERALLALSQASAGADGALRLFAVRALGQLGTPARATRHAIEARLADELPAVRATAIGALVAVSTEVDAARNAQLLEPLLRDPFEEVRARAERALAERRSDP